jgi:hypothetical protein
MCVNHDFTITLAHIRYQYRREHRCFASWSREEPSKPYISFFGTSGLTLQIYVTDLHTFSRGEVVRFLTPSS